MNDNDNIMEWTDIYKVKNYLNKHEEGHPVDTIMHYLDIYDEIVEAINDNT